MKRITTGISISLVISALFHLGVFSGLYWKTAKSEGPTQDLVEIDFTPKVIKRKQIVEQETQVNKQEPNDDAYLSKFSQKVDEQTLAQKAGEYKDASGGGNFLKSQKKLKPQAQKKISKESLKKMDLSQLGPQFKWAPSDSANQEAFVGEESQSQDYLENVSKSNRNLLNTKEFKYYTYYTRIRKQLSQYWEPSLREKLHRMLVSGRRIASTQTKVTRLLITLNTQGNLMGIQVLEDSGIRDLDDAATEAFKKAAPFPNPPLGILEADGTVKIRWDFVLEA